MSLKEIRDAIVDGFDDVSLTETLKFYMNLDFKKKIPQNVDFEHQVFKLIEWAEQRGRDVELMQVTARANPKNARVQEIYQKYGLAIPVFVQEAGVAQPAAPADASDRGLEKIVKPYLEFADFGIWREQMTRVEGQVCRITLNGAARGTGFLVGPDSGADQLPRHGAGAEGAVIGGGRAVRIRLQEAQGRHAAPDPGRPACDGLRRVGSDRVSS